MRLHVGILVLLVLISTCLASRLIHDGDNIVQQQLVEEEEESQNNKKEQHLNNYWAQIIKDSHSHSTNSTIMTSDLLVESAASLGLFLQKFTELELGIKETKAAYESVSFDTKREKSPEEQVQELANKMTLEMKVYQDALDRMVTVTKSSFELEYQLSALPLCCNLNAQEFQYYENYNTAVGKSSACWSIPPRSRTNLFVPGKEFSDVLIANAEKLTNLKWQYFVSADGVQIQYPSNKQNCPNSNEDKTSSFPSLLNAGKSTSDKKPWLIQKSKSDTQIHRIIFLIQLDSNTTAVMIKSIKNIVFQVLKLLDEADEVGIIHSEPDQLWSNFICDQMLRTSSWTRFQIINYLNYLENRYKSTNPFSQVSGDSPDSKPDHYLGLERAIEMACQNSSESSTLFPPCATTIVQLSSSGIDTTKFASRTLRVNCPIFIESFFLQPYNISEEEEFRKSIQNVASRNIWRVQVFSLGQTDPDTFADKVALQLTTKKEWWSLSDILSQFFPRENDYSQNFREFSLPHWNHVSKELVIGAKRYVFYHGRPLGLVSIEIPLMIFTQHIVSFTNENVCDARNYAFLIDKNGRVVIHPAFGKPDLSKGSFSSVPIEQLEVYSGFSALKKKILIEQTGCASLRSKQENTWITYAWANSLNYIVVLTFFGESGGCNSDKYAFVLRKNALSTNEIQYHLLLDKTLCCNNQLISINKAGLYLSPNAFHRPADVVNYETSRRHFKRLLALMAYIGDHSGMIQNPKGELKSSTKHHIGVLAPSVPIWKQRYFQSDWNKYILRRFASGGGGTFMLIYPGVQISAGYIPKSTSWFRQAVIGEGKLIFSPPTFDHEVKLPVITMSQVINMDLATPFSQKIYKTPVAVVGADLHAGFLQKLIQDILPECWNISISETNRNGSQVVSSRCFLVDENGIVIYHPHLTGTLHTLSSVHITQLEPLSIIDILQQTQNNGQASLRKYMCHKVSETSVTQGSLKRMYKFSMGVEGILKSKHGELCHLYFIVPIHQTNLFLGIVRDGCSSTTAFCPCSTVDNLCLNCLRMEPSDCECPCECPREPSFCLRHSFIDLPDDIVPCGFPDEDIPMIRVETEERCHERKVRSDKNFSCDYLRNSCSSITQSNMCTGSWNCEWCLVNDTSAICSKYSECYGITNEKTLVFSNRLNEQLREDESKLAVGESDSQITLVPVLGVLSVFLVFIALVIYCYRHRALTISDSQPNLHLLPLQDNPVGLMSPSAHQHSPSESDNEADNVPIRIPIVGLHRLRNNHIILPPRSPVASTVSDLGYSTMTGENISECGAPLDAPPKSRHNVDTFEVQKCKTRKASHVLVPVSVHVPWSNEYD